MNTLVHIVRFCVRESVAHAQKEYKVSHRFKCLKLVCTLLDLKLNQSNKICVYIIPAILISFYQIKICVYNMKQIRKFTWLQAYDLGDVRVIWCNSLGDSLFQILCDEFCRLCVYFYSYITSHISQAFASCTHYTSYYLLNFVHVIVCVFGLTSQVWKFLEFYANHIWCLRI